MSEHKKLPGVRAGIRGPKRVKSGNRHAFRIPANPGALRGRRPGFHVWSWSEAVPQKPSKRDIRREMVAAFGPLSGRQYVRLRKQMRREEKARSGVPSVAGLPVQPPQ